MPERPNAAGPAWPDPRTPVLLSALRHYLYCPRSCALIHLEGMWSENRFTVDGRNFHETADRGKVEKRGNLKIASGCLLCSESLGLVGKADMVEFRWEGNRWIPFPVEYKRGRVKDHDADRVQLCAQALCLEEMTGTSVPEGALYYGKSKRRHAVSFDQGLRQLTLTTVEQVRCLLDQSHLPDATELSLRCPHCSLRSVCQPEQQNKAASHYLRTLCEAT